MTQFIEGYAALFGVADLEGDVVHKGAFRASLSARRTPLPMYVQHDARLRAGVWRTAYEDARGLYVKGEIEADAPAASMARRMIARGADGLSIGFVTRQAVTSGSGRALYQIDLLEASLVTVPMQPLARLFRAGASRSPN